MAMGREAGKGQQERGREAGKGQQGRQRDTDRDGDRDKEGRRCEREWCGQVICGKTRGTEGENRAGSRQRTKRVEELQ